MSPKLWRGPRPPGDLNLAQSPKPPSWKGFAGLILSALLAGNRPLTWQDSSAETAYKELITHIHRYKAPGTGESGMPARKRGRSSYYQWSSKAEGKTITRTLTEDEAKLYQEWIENDRKLRSILKEMRRASEHATQLILKQKVK